MSSDSDSSPLATAAVVGAAALLGWELIWKPYALKREAELQAQAQQYMQTHPGITFDQAMMIVSTVVCMGAATYYQVPPNISGPVCSILGPLAYKLEKYILLKEYAAGKWLLKKNWAGAKWVGGKLYQGTEKVYEGTKAGLELSYKYGVQRPLELGYEYGVEKPLQLATGTATTVLHTGEKIATSTVNAAKTAASTAEKTASTAVHYANPTNWF